jgi:glycosyltransferase involved in cell wall biosynthesis
MAAGTPVVATRSGGILETITDHETGFLVERNDSHALVEAILKLLEKDALRESMGRAARRQAVEYFHWDTIVAAMHDRYQSLCGEDSMTGTLCVQRSSEARLCSKEENVNRLLT